MPFSCACSCSCLAVAPPPPPPVTALLSAQVRGSILTGWGCRHVASLRHGVRSSALLKFAHWVIWSTQSLNTNRSVDHSLACVSSLPAHGSQLMSLFEACWTELPPEARLVSYHLKSSTLAILPRTWPPLAWASCKLLSHSLLIVVNSSLWRSWFTVRSTFNNTSMSWNS